MKTPVFLRDLKEELRLIEEQDIREEGTEELKKALEDGEDIVIGYYLERKEYSTEY